MPNYIVLIQLTDQGLREMPNMVSRMRANKKAAEDAGFKVTPFVTLGEYDQVVFTEAPDDQSALRAVLGLVGQGNARTRTLRAFGIDELEQILAPAPAEALSERAGE